MLPVISCLVLTNFKTIIMNVTHFSFFFWFNFICLRVIYNDAEQFRL